MSSDSNNTQTETLKKRRRILKWFSYTVLSVLIIFFIAWSFLPANVLNLPVILERDESGEFVKVKDENKSPALTFQARAGALNSNNSISSYISTTSSNPRYFSCESIAVFLLSEHLIIKRAGEELVKNLEEENLIKRIEYYPFGHLPQSGSPATDLIITLDVNSLKTSGFLASKLEADIRFTWGSRFAEAASHYNDDLTPPHIQIYSQGDIKHNSTFKGVESSSADLSFQGEDIGNEIAKNVLKAIREHREKYLPVPELPIEYHPEYTKAPDFQFIQSLKAKHLISQHSLCIHNETYWRINGVTDPENLLKTVHKELEEIGWKGSPGDVDSQNDVFQRMTKENQVLEVFSSKDGISIPLNAEQPSEIDIYIRYQNRMSKESHQSAYQEMLNSSATYITQLIAMRKYASRTQKDELFNLVKETKPHNAEAWIFLAKYYQGKNQNKEIFNALRSAYLFSMMLIDPDNIENQIEGIAKKAKIDMKQIKGVNFDSFDALGFPEVTEKSNQSVTMDSGQSTHFIARSSKGDWKLLSVILHDKTQANNQLNYDITIMEQRNGGGKSWSRQTYDLANNQSNSRAYIEDISTRVYLSITENDLLQVTVKRLDEDGKPYQE